MKVKKNAKSSQPNSLMTVHEAAAETRQSASKIYYEIRNGAFPSVKLGRRVLVPRKELVKFLDANTTTTARVLGQE